MRALVRTGRGGQKRALWVTGTDVILSVCPSAQILSGLNAVIPIFILTVPSLCRIACNIKNRGPRQVYAQAYYVNRGPSALAPASKVVEV